MPSTEMHFMLRWGTRAQTGGPLIPLRAPTEIGICIRAGGEQALLKTSSQRDETIASGSLDLQNTPWKEFQLTCTLPGKPSTNATSNTMPAQSSVYTIATGFVPLPELQDQGQHQCWLDVSRYVGTDANTGFLGQPQSSIHVLLTTTPLGAVSIPRNLRVEGSSVVDSLKFLDARLLRVLAGIVGDNGVLDKLNVATPVEGTTQATPQQLAAVRKQVLSGSMLMPDGQLMMLSSPMDAAFLHATTEAFAEVAAVHSKDMQLKALEAWIDARRIQQRTPGISPAQAVNIAMHHLARKCDYAFDTAWDIKDNAIVVSEQNGENFLCNGTAAISAVGSEQIVGALSAAVAGMGVAHDVDDLRSHIREWNTASTLLNKSRLDCEDISGLIHIVGYIMAQDARKGPAEFARRYAAFAPLFVMHPDAYSAELPKLHAWASKAMPANAVFATSLVLAGGAKVDGEKSEAAQADGGAGVHAGATTPGESLMRMHAELQAGTLAGHAVATWHEAGAELGHFNTRVDNDNIEYIVRRAPDTYNFVEGTAETSLVPDENKRTQTSITTQAVVGGAYENGIPMEIAGLCSTGTKFDAMNKIAALAAKQMTTCTSSLGLAVMTNVAYTQTNNFYKVMLSSGPELLFHVANPEAAARAAQSRSRGAPAIDTAATFADDKTSSAPMGAPATARRAIGRGASMDAAADTPPQQTIVVVLDEGNNADIQTLPAALAQQMAERLLIEGAVKSTGMACGARCDDLCNGKIKAIAVERKISALEKQHIMNYALFARASLRTHLSLDHQTNFAQRQRLGLLYRSIVEPVTGTVYQQHHVRNTITISGVVTCLPHVLAHVMTNTCDYAAAQSAFEEEDAACATMAQMFWTQYTDAHEAHTGPISSAQAGVSHFTVPDDITQLALSQHVFNVSK